MQRRCGLRAARAGLTMVEIALSILILGMAMLPIMDILTRSTGLSKRERTEAAAANFAALLMNRYLYEKKWSELTDLTDQEESVSTDASLKFRFSLTVRDAWPVTQAMTVKRCKYHSPCGGTCSQYEDLDRRAPKDINSTFCSGPIFRTLTLTFQWKGPGDEYDDIKKVVLVGRRARLDEANK